MKKLLAALLFLTAWAPAGAQTWPGERPVRLIVPFVPGGATDVAARLVSEFLSRSTGGNFIVENRGGAGGNLGMAEAARSTPDGHTILVMNDAIASNPHYYRLNFDPVTDFVPVIELGRQPVVVAAHPSLGVSNLAELVKLAKTKTDLSYGTAGAGSQHNILGEWFSRSAAIKLQHVGYRGGGAAVNDLIGAHVPLALLASTPFISLAKSGQVKLLAQSMDRRASSLPDVPTFREQGYPDIVLDQWTGVFVPKGTPPAIIERINEEMGKALADAIVRSKFEELAVEPVSGTSERFSSAFRADYEKYRKLLSMLGMQSG